MTDVLAKDDKEEEDITDILKVEDRLIIKTKMYYKYATIFLYVKIVNFMLHIVIL